MKRFFAFLVLILAGTALAAPLRYGPGTTNTPTAWTNVVLSIGSIGAITPMQFGGVGSENGTITADDTLAVSNAIVQLNVKGGVLSLANRLWYVSQQLPVITASQVVVENGGILTSNKSIYLLGLDQGDHSGGVRRNSRFINLTLGRMGYGDAPNNTSVGLRLGTNNLYGLNAFVQNCMITNFWRGVELAGISQSWLDHNFIAGNWSNNVYVGVSSYNPDGFKLTYNDINNNDILPQPDAVLTNAILVQFEQGCLNAQFEGNNAGGGKQAFYSSQSGNFKFLNNQWELFRSANSSNLVLFHFTNSAVQMDGEGGYNGIYGLNPYGSSNYLAGIGLYGLCNFDACYFKSPAISGGYSFDIWQREPGSQPGGTVMPYMDSAYFVRTHATYGDTGNTITSTRGNIPKTTDPTTRWWGTNTLFFDGDVLFNNGADLGYTFGADVNVKGTYSGNNLLWRSAHRLGNGGYGTFIVSQAFDTSVYDVNLGGDPVVQRTAPLRWRIFTSPDISTAGSERWRFENSSLTPMLTTNTIGSGSSPLGTLFTTNIVGALKTPASASATGTAGTILWDANYIYICTAANTWKRVAIATW